MNQDICFSRAELRLVLADVIRHDAAVRIKDAWVWRAGKDHYEFHFGSFYWHGRADNAYDARSRGWAAWLAQAGVDGYCLAE